MDWSYDMTQHDSSTPLTFLLQVWVGWLRGRGGMCGGGKIGTMCSGPYPSMGPPRSLLACCRIPRLKQTFTSPMMVDMAKMLILRVKKSSGWTFHMETKVHSPPPPPPLDRGPDGVGPVGAALAAFF